MARTYKYISNWNSNGTEATLIDSRHLEYRGIGIHQKMWLRGGKIYYTQQVLLPKKWWTDEDFTCQWSSAKRAAKLAMDVIDNYFIHEQS